MSHSNPIPDDLISSIVKTLAENLVYPLGQLTALGYDIDLSDLTNRVNNQSNQDIRLADSGQHLIVTNWWESDQFVKQGGDQDRITMSFLEGFSIPGEEWQRFIGYVQTTPDYVPNIDQSEVYRTRNVFWTLCSKVGWGESLTLADVKKHYNFDRETLDFLFTKMVKENSISGMYLKELNMVITDEDQIYAKQQAVQETLEKMVGEYEELNATVDPSSETIIQRWVGMVRKFDQLVIPPISLSIQNGFIKELDEILRFHYQKLGKNLARIREEVVKDVLRQETITNLRKEREDFLKKLFKKVKRMKLEEIADYLQYSDVPRLKRIIFDLSEPSPLVIDKEDIIVEDNCLLDRLEEVTDEILSALDDA